MKSRNTEWFRTFLAAVAARALRAPGPPRRQGSKARTTALRPRTLRGRRPRRQGRPVSSWSRPRLSRRAGVRGRRSGRQGRPGLLRGLRRRGDLATRSRVGGRLDVLGRWPLDRGGPERRGARGRDQGDGGGEAKSGRRAHVHRLLGGGRRAQAVRPARATAPRSASVDPRAEDARQEPHHLSPRACVSWLLGPARRRRGWASSGSRRAPP